MKLWTILIFVLFELRTEIAPVFYASEHIELFEFGRGGRATDYILVTIARWICSVFVASWFYV